MAGWSIVSGTECAEDGRGETGVDHVEEPRGQERPLVLRLVLVLSGDSEARDSIAREVDLDEDRRLIARDPGVVPGRDVDHRGRRQINATYVGVLEADGTRREEADMSVTAVVGADQRT